MGGCQIKNKTFTTISIGCRPGYNGGLKQYFVAILCPYNSFSSKIFTFLQILIRINVYRFLAVFDTFFNTRHYHHQVLLAVTKQEGPNFFLDAPKIVTDGRYKKEIVFGAARNFFSPPYFVMALVYA